MGRSWAINKRWGEGINKYEDIKFGKENKASLGFVCAIYGDF